MGIKERWKNCVILLILLILLVCYYEYSIVQTKPEVKGTGRIGSTGAKETGRMGKTGAKQTGRVGSVGVKGTGRIGSTGAKDMGRIGSKSKSMNKNQEAYGKNKGRLNLNVTQGSGGSQVLLMTYLRSGSSFLGAIVQQVPRALYSFEPMKSYLTRQTYISTERGTCLFSNDRCTPTPKDDYSGIMENFKNFYECELRILDPFLRRRISGRKCHLEDDQEKCISEMIPYCKSGTRIAKTIRLSMDVVDVLMEKFPNLKVIHLLRDPRGMIVSRMKTIPALGIRKMDMSLAARAVCDRYNRDIRIGQSLDVKYPNRIKTVLYEQIVEKPLETSLRIFQFLGLHPNKNFNTWMNEHIAGVQKVANPPDTHNHAYSTYRANSSATANAWRSRLIFENVVKIDKECSQLYDYTGYVSVKSSTQLTNFNIPLRKKNANFP
ncbi:carbohydrate sulfotransferase 1-like [Pecten maximus]|uniref:carbohydrate sulfotransferase 1-like n=1 Tax=Pecten maximus TaxID=6579 RepID=UPI001458A094|nr:carbohydrate sulfotransferase 1-like [Pecten maximus]